MKKLIPFEMRYITIFVLIVLATAAEQPRWQNEKEIESWIRSQESLEIDEYAEVLEFFSQQSRTGRKWEESQEIFRLSEELAYSKFEELMANRNHAGVCELFNLVGAHLDLKRRMMNSLGECEDLDEYGWAPRRGSVFRNMAARQNLFNEIMGESETLEQIVREYGDEDSVGSKTAIKQALEKKWPGLQRKGTRETKEFSEPERTAPVGSKSHPEKSTPENHLEESGKPGLWLWIASPLLLFAALFAFLRLQRG
jgi:hypothetical protein